MHNRDISFAMAYPMLKTLSILLQNDLSRLFRKEKSKKHLKNLQICYLNFLKLSTLRRQLADTRTLEDVSKRAFSFTKIELNRIRICNKN